MNATAAGSVPAIPVMTQVAIYGTGIFANSSTGLIWVLLPLWLVSLNATPAEIGLAVGVRAVLPFLLAIPGGAMMDRLGVKRLVLVCALAGMVIPPLYPLLPAVAATIALQAVSGVPGSMGWIGCQAMLGQVMKGNPLYTGRMSFYLRIGTFLGPLLAGVAWDLFGAWGGFGILFLWSLLHLIAASFLPDVRPEPVEQAPRRRVPAGLGDYRDALRLLLMPMIAIVIVVSLLRMSQAVIVGSFYVVYLEDIGYTGSLIGFLVGSGQLMSAGGALIVARLTRIVRDYWLLIGATAMSILAVTLTPFLTSFVPLLIASGLRGFGTGITQPLMISIGQMAAGAGNQGKAAALRTSVNRMAEALVPILMGGVAQLVGVENAFFVMGGGYSPAWPVLPSMSM